MFFWIENRGLGWHKQKRQMVTSRRRSSPSERQASSWECTEIRQKGKKEKK